MRNKIEVGCNKNGIAISNTKVTAISNCSKNSVKIKKLLFPLLI